MNAINKGNQLGSLENFGARKLQLSAEHPVPEPASDSESILVVSKVML
jgi:hypothetical protein